MAWRLLFDLWEYMCMTHPLMAGLYAPQGVDLGGGGSLNKEWHSMQSGLSGTIVQPVKHVGKYLAVYSSLCYIKSCIKIIIYHIWTIPRSRLISWLRGKVKTDQLTWCEGQGWTWHTLLTPIYGRKWTLGRSRLNTWPSSPKCSTSLSLVWNLVEETTTIYAGLFGNIYIQNLIQN